MAFKTFTAGAVLTASDVNTYLAKQAVVVCTSTTRPSSPPEGMTIYETDTDRLLVYTSSGVQWVQPWSQPWGVVTATSGGTSGYGYVKLTTSAQTGIGSTATDITNATVTFTALASRLYKVTAQADLIGSTSSTAQFQVIVDGTASATAVSGVTGASGAYEDRMPALVYATTLSAGSHTVKLSASVKTGSLTINHSTATPTVLMVEDVGPAGAPA